jgi:hypothetical protein
VSGTTPGRANSLAGLAAALRLRISTVRLVAPHPSLILPWDCCDPSASASCLCVGGGGCHPGPDGALYQKASHLRLLPLPPCTS